ncbi:hypothetical protein MASR2M36_35260 [Providencia sp.]
MIPMPIAGSTEIRADLLDAHGACFALRPEGIEWPENEDGLPGMRTLTKANGVAHENAHDAQCPDGQQRLIWLSY